MVKNYLKDIDNEELVPGFVVVGATVVVSESAPTKEDWIMIEIFLCISTRVK